MSPERSVTYVSERTLLNHRASASLLLVIVIKESGTGSASVRSQLQDADARYGRELTIIREKAGAAGR